MMEVVIPRPWKEHFRLAAEERAEDMRWRERMTRSEARQHEQRADQLAKEKHNAEERAIIQQVFATPERIEFFTRRLDRYDTATVEALMENSVLLDKLRERLDTMLMEAHVLPDGRRVFKTRDCTRVFDEHGAELKPEAIDPNLIDDTRPRWEEFKGVRSTTLGLERDRRELLDYQSRLDSVRELVDKVRVSENDLEDLSAALDKEMPDAMRRRLAGDTPDANTETDFRRSRPPFPAITREDTASPQPGLCGPRP